MTTLAISDGTTAAHTLAPSADERVYRSFLTRVPMPPVSTSGDWKTFSYTTTTIEGPRGQHVRLPIPVRVRQTSKYIAIIEPTSGIHGVGKSRNDAVRDFWQAVRDFDSMSPEPSLRSLRRALDLLATVLAP